jgi:hypothetical protein
LRRCLLHTIEWLLEPLHQKLHDKSRFKEVFDSLHDIKFMYAEGNKEEHISAVDSRSSRHSGGGSDGAVVQVHWQIPFQ